MSQEERLQILKMVQDGKLTAEEAARLLQAVDTPEGKVESAHGPARWLRIRVTDTRTSHPKVNINLPVSLLTWALKFLPQGVSIDQQDLMQMIKEGGIGKIIDVEEDDEKVEISLE